MAEVLTQVEGPVDGTFVCRAGGLETLESEVVTMVRSVILLGSNLAVQRVTTFKLKVTNLRRKGVISVHSVHYRVIPCSLPSSV